MLKYLLLVLCLPHVLWAQEAIPIGSWRTHFSFQNTHTLALAGQKVYTATTNGLFYYDKDDKSVNVLSKIDGLHDVGIVAMAYHQQQEALVIAYRSGGIDVLSENNIYANNLLKESSSTQAEQIYQISFLNDTVFIATSLGIRVFLLDVSSEKPLSILESYTRLSEDGAADLPVYGSTFVRDSIFIGTREGILAASLSPLINRQDFSNWRRFGVADGLPPQPVRHIEKKGDDVFAGADKDALYRYTNGTWERTAFSTSGDFTSLSANGETLLIVADHQLFTYNGGEAKAIDTNLVQKPSDARYDAQQVLWVADEGNGLVKVNNAQEENFFPSGPPTDDTWKVTFAGDKVIGLAGKYSDSFIPAGNSTGFYTFEKGIWQNYTEITENISIADLVDVVYHPASQQFYFASFGDGIGVWDGEENITLVDENTSGSTLINSSPPERFTRIAALDTDSEGRLWIANYGVNFPLHVWNPQNDNWKAYSFLQNEGRFPLDLLVSVSGDKWILLKNGEILVFNHETGDERYLNSGTGEGGLPGEKATAMVSDKDGLIWVGTDQGVAFFPDPFSVFSGDVDAIRPIFDRRPLLRDQKITAMAVDGGNRKWIGTPNGLWLFDETGETQINNFTIDNSPLPSNYIKSIAIDGVSGEVFIATDKGMVSYRGTATEGGQRHESVKIFPNPVITHMHETVGMSGLADDAIVKVTTVTGTLVREIRAEGGTVTWNVTDYNGTRVATGVYLVFSASPGGAETFVGKIAVVN